MWLHRIYIVPVSIMSVCNNMRTKYLETSSDDTHAALVCRLSVELGRTPHTEPTTLSHGARSQVSPGSVSLSVAPWSLHLPAAPSLQHPAEFHLLVAPHSVSQFLASVALVESETDTESTCMSEMFIFLLLTRINFNSHGNDGIVFESLHNVSASLLQALVM